MAPDVVLTGKRRSDRIDHFHVSIVFYYTDSYSLTNSTPVSVAAAHCANNFGNGRVLVGAVRKSAENVGNAQWRNILGQKYVHPNYVTKNENNDLMIFKIEPVTKPNLRPIALNGMQNRPRAGQQLKIIGFGAVDNGNTFLPELRQATVKYMKNSVCNRRWIGYQIHQKTHLCAANFRARSDICSGDSGRNLYDDETLFSPFVDWCAVCGSTNSLVISPRK